MQASAPFVPLGAQKKMTKFDKIASFCCCAQFFSVVAAFDQIEVLNSLCAVLAIFWERLHGQFLPEYLL
jgi:hypothetical protein